MKNIGILLRENNGYKILNNELVKVLNNYDVNILGIVYDDIMDFNKISNIINLCDGVILQGGSDESLMANDIAKYLYDINKPTLGICLGMQNMALASNGFVDKIENHNSTLKYTHKINIKRGSLLSNILNNNTILVNSRHNYYVVKTDLSISAYSDDYIIEAIEDKNKKFYLGVQWHPESIANDLNSKLIIDEFINSC